MERSVEEFMRFFFVMIAERTRPNQRQSVEQDPYIGHVYARGDGLCGIVVTDKEYPSRVAFMLLNKIQDDFVSKNPNPDRWAAAQFPELKDYIVRFQDPKQADSIMRVQQELDETKIILHKTIQGVLERGENLENLMDRSEELSNQSKIFLKTAKKTNSCCIVM